MNFRDLGEAWGKVWRVAHPNARKGESILACKQASDRIRFPTEKELADFCDGWDTGSTPSTEEVK